MSEEKEQSDDVVTIMYRVDKDGEFFVDALLTNYEPKTIEDLSTLLASIPSMKFQIQTVNIIKNAFLEEGREKELEALLSSVLLKSEQFAKTLENRMKEEGNDKGTNEDSEKDEPCIKPTEML